MASVQSAIEITRFLVLVFCKIQIVHSGLVAKPKPFSLLSGIDSMNMDKEMNKISFRRFRLLTTFAQFGPNCTQKLNSH